MHRNSLHWPSDPHPGPRPARDATALGQAAKLVERAPDPHGSPRPFRDARDVPLRTSLYLELATPPGAKAGEVAARLGVGEPATRRRRGRRAAAAGQSVRGGRLGVAAAEERPLGRPVARRLHRAPRAAAARDAIHRDSARLGRPRGRLGRATGSALPSVAGTWSFTTEAAEPSHRLAFPLDLAAEPVRWHGRFFSGVCNVIFCSQAANYGPTYDLMAEARKQHPRAWSYQRDFWPTGTEFRPPSSFLANRLPNIVRERETRRIAAIEPREGSVLLRVEDFFGHEQYGIPSGRSVAEDYHAGDEVLIADGVHDARTNSPRRRRRGRHGDRRPLPDPARRLEDRLRRRRSPSGEDPDAPGLFRTRRMRPPQVPPARHAVLFLGPARQGVRPDPSPVRPPVDGQLRRRHGRPRSRRPELDDREGPRRVARRRPHDRRPRHRSLRRRVARLHLERVQRARPGRPLLAGELGRAARVLRLHNRRHPAGLRGPRL